MDYEHLIAGLPRRLRRFKIAFVIMASIFILSVALAVFYLAFIWASIISFLLLILIFPLLRAEIELRNLQIQSNDDIKFEPGDFLFNETVEVKIKTLFDSKNRIKVRRLARALSTQAKKLKLLLYSLVWIGDIAGRFSFSGIYFQSRAKLLQYPENLANLPLSPPSNVKPTIPEKIHKFKEQLEWLQLIPRLKRARITLLSKVLGIDESVIRDTLPALAQDFGFQADEEYVRLPESVSDFIDALGQVFAHWKEFYGEKHGNGQFPVRTEAWFSVLGEIFVGSTTFKRSWILKILDITDVDFFENITLWESEFGIKIENDQITLNIDALSKIDADIEIALENSLLRTDQIEFINDLDGDIKQNLASQNMKKPNKINKKWNKPEDKQG
ncbi:MAG TPA: hypothetical protein VKK79_14415 [Candidatus Lokiarchaeia archaeon]|nr:hypothetical protein [Candidatus Lokiarchaeia archaeon]